MAKNEQSEKTYIYDTAYNGVTVRVPAEKYEAWKKEQELYKSGKKQPPESAQQMAQELMKLLKKQKP